MFSGLHSWLLITTVCAHSCSFEGGNRWICAAEVFSTFTRNALGAGQDTALSRYDTRFFALLLCGHSDCPNPPEWGYISNISSSTGLPSADLPQARYRAGAHPQRYALSGSISRHRSVPALILLLQAKRKNNTFEPWTLLSAKLY